MKYIMHLSIIAALSLACMCAELQVLHAIPGTTRVDVLINNLVVQQNLGYKEMSSSVKVNPGLYSIEVKQTGTNTVIVSARNVTMPNANVTAIAVSRPNLPSSVIFLNEPFPANNTVSLARLVHVAPIGSSPPTIGMRVGNTTAFPVVQFLWSSGYYAFEPRTNATVDIFEFRTQRVLKQQFYHTLKNGVDFATGQATTFFLVGNDSDYPVDIVTFNQGIPAVLPDLSSASESASPSTSFSGQTHSRSRSRLRSRSQSRSRADNDGGAGGRDSNDAHDESISYVSLMVAVALGYIFQR